MVNINAPVRRDFPAWNIRGKIRKTDDAGNVLENEHAYGGEFVRISPRYQRAGTNFRVRPERPAYFFNQFLFEHGILPAPLTPEECETEAGLEILQPLFEQYKSYLANLESPFAASDLATQPSLKDGYSFCVLQVLVEQIGSFRSEPTRQLARPNISGVRPSASVFDRIKQQIEAMRSRNGTKSSGQPPAKKTA